jgi:hypothetical protein
MMVAALLAVRSRFLRSFACAMVFGGSFIALTAPGCASEGVGDPCTPEQEYQTDFLGFDEDVVSVESKSVQCRTRVCLVNHFRGRVSCPYGQGSDATPPAGASACTVPGSEKAIDGKVINAALPPEERTYVDPEKRSLVEPQCLDRKAADSVYCSCRCADLNGNRPSDQAFCDCPDGFTCERLVTSIGQGNEGLTGSYCIKKGTAYDRLKSCRVGYCDKNAPNSQCE